ncbi:MAG: hypothetical protein OWS03_02945 [Alicyclobacillaceae bacterium]|nr:hypothetical protein [Alicyclobacillaceae bacterium]
MVSMKRHTYLTLSIVLALGAGGLAYFGYSHAVREEKVLIANTQILPDSPVPGTALSYGEMSVAAAEQYGFLTHPNEVAGRYLSTGVAKGQPISVKDLATAKDLNALLANYQKKTGRSGVILPFNNNNLFSGVVTPGQEVALSYRGKIHHQEITGLVGPIQVLAEQTVKGKPSFILFLDYAQYQLMASDITHGTTHIVLYTKGVPLMSASKALAEEEGSVTVSASSRPAARKASQGGTHS